MSLINHISNNNLEEVKNQNDIINEIYNNLENKSLGNLDLSINNNKVRENKTFFKNKNIEIGNYTGLNNFTIKQNYFDIINKTITDIILPSSLTSISTYAFYNCTNLASIELSSGIASIGESAFSGCTNLALTELSSGIASIGESAFSGCSNLKTMKIKCQQLDGTKIFSNCSNLTKVWISSNCTTITAPSRQRSPFIGCPDTLEIYINATEELSGWGYYFNRTGLLGSVEATVHYNVSEAEFDAIIIEGGEA